MNENWQIVYSRRKILTNTLCFVIGVSFAFFLLGLGFTAAGSFFGKNRTAFARIGGIIVILFGLYQLGIFQSNFLMRERRLPFQLDSLAMNPFLALIMGFTFSFAWTPCVGPALASVLLMASSARSQTMGFALIGVYTLGFVVPFLAVGLFTGTVLDFFKKHQNVVKYTAKAGGVLMIIMGIMMFTGWLNGVTGYLSGLGTGGAGNQTEGVSEPPKNPEDPVTEPVTKPAGEQTEGSSEKQTTLSDPSERVEAPDFTLTDQYGNTHSLSDYRGKVVFLNFWATWCGPCRKEMPDIEAIYQEHGENSEDLVILSVANPKTEDNPNNNDKTIEEVSAFMEENGYTYPSLMDTTGEVLVNYYITAFPTTFMIDREGRVIGYVNGTMTKDIMENIIEQSLSEASEGGN